MKYRIPKVITTGLAVTVAVALFSASPAVGSEISSAGTTSRAASVGLSVSTLTPTTPLWQLPITITPENVSCPAKLQMSAGTTPDILVRKNVDLCSGTTPRVGPIQETMPVFDRATGASLRPGQTAQLSAALNGNPVPGVSFTVPQAPIWVAVGDSYSSGHHQDSDKLVAPRRRPLPPTNLQCLYIRKWSEPRGCSVHWNDRGWSWATRATNYLTAQLGVPARWVMTPTVVAKSGAPVRDYLNPKAPHGTQCTGCGQVKAMSEALAKVPNSWNVVSITGGANDGNFEDVLKTYYGLWAVGRAKNVQGKPWDVGLSVQCPDIDKVYKRLDNPTVRGQIFKGLRETAETAQKVSASTRIVDVNYPYVVKQDNVCSKDGSNGRRGARSVIDLLAKKHEDAMQGIAGVHYLDLRPLLGSSDPLPKLQLTRYYGYPHVNDDGQYLMASRAGALLMGSSGLT